MNEIVRANQSSSDQINISYNTNFTRSYITLHTIERKQYSALQHSPVLLSWQQASSLSWQRQVLWSTSVGGWWQRQRLQRRRCVSNSNRTHLQQLLTIWHRAAAAAAYTDGGSGRWRLTGSNWLHARLADWASENVIQAVGRSPTRPGLHNAHCTTTTTTTTIHHHPPSLLSPPSPSSSSSCPFHSSSVRGSVSPSFLVVALSSMPLLKVSAGAPLQDHPAPEKSPPADNLQAKIGPARRPPGRDEFLTVNCRPGETFMGGTIL